MTQPEHGGLVVAAEVRRGGFTALAGLGEFAREGHTGLEVKGVTVRYGGLVALNAIDLTVPAAAAAP